MCVCDTLDTTVREENFVKSWRARARARVLPRVLDIHQSLDFTSRLLDSTGWLEGERNAFNAIKVKVKVSVHLHGYLSAVPRTCTY